MYCNTRTNIIDKIVIFVNDSMFSTKVCFIHLNIHNNPPPPPPPPCKKNKSKLNETKRVVPSKKSPQFGVTKEKEKVIKLTESDLKNLINKVIDKTN